jgi:hypothetical protein
LTNHQIALELPLDLSSFREPISSARTSCRTMQRSKRDHRSTPPERSQIQPAGFLMANNRCLPGLRHAPWRVLAIQHWRRLLRFGRYTAAFRSTAHTRPMECRTRYWPKPPSPCDVVSPGVPRRSAASRGPPSVFAMERAGADGAIAPLMPPKFALVLQSVRLYLSYHYSWKATPLRPSTKFAK